MTDNQEENKGYIATPEKNKKETQFDREERLKLEHKEKIRIKNLEVKQLLEKYDDLENSDSEKEEKIIKLEAANKALDRALNSERIKKESGTWQAQTEGEIISNMASDILMLRCKSGRYGVKCDKH